MSCFSVVFICLYISMNYEYVDNNTRINKSLKNMSPIELIEHKKKLAKTETEGLI